MSELLYLFGEIDERVRPLIFFVRRWAEEWDVTRIIRPGPFISNFTLSCLVLFFLQQLKQPILPSINELKRQAGPSDNRFIGKFIDCTFLRDINHLNFKTTNTDSLEELIMQFFDFYANLDFEESTISLNTGHKMPQDTESRAMTIINPLESGVNVSVNVSRNETNSFKRKAKLASEKFRELNRELKASPPNRKIFVEFFQCKENNYIRESVMAKMNISAQPPMNPRMNASPQRLTNQKKKLRKKSLTIRSLTELT